VKCSLKLQVSGVLAVFTTFQRFPRTLESIILSSLYALWLVPLIRKYCWCVTLVKTKQSVLYLLVDEMGIHVLVQQIGVLFCIVFNGT
jgi:hypothetical protein